MTRLTRKIQDLSRRSPLTSIDVPDLNSSTTKEGGTHVEIWFAVLAAVAGAGALSGVSITIGISALWFVACVVPPVVMLMVWRGAPPPTVAEILHAVDRRD